MKPRMQHGFALVSAIFILVVLAALGAFAASVSSTQHMSATQDLQGTRMLHAARTGLEWGAYMVTRGGSSCAAATTNAAPATATSMQGITVTVNCDASMAPLYKITATACNQPSGGTCPNTASPTVTYVERQVEMVLQYP